MIKLKKQTIALGICLLFLAINTHASYKQGIVRDEKQKIIRMQRKQLQCYQNLLLQGGDVSFDLLNKYHAECSAVYDYYRNKQMAVPMLVAECMEVKIVAPLLIAKNGK